MDAEDPYLLYYTPPPKEWRFVEFFAGEAHVTDEVRLSSYRGICLDITYGGQAMDLTTPSGMGFPS